MKIMYLNTYKAAIEYHKKWSNPPKNDTEFNECFEDMQKAFSQTDKDSFAKEMLLCVYREIDRKYCEAHGDKREII